MSDLAAVEAIRSMLIIKCLRPDRLLQATARFVRLVFNTELSSQSDYDLGTMVNDEVPAATPLALISVPGYDASYRVENLIKNTGARSSSVAMGSQGRLRLGGPSDCGQQPGKVHGFS